MSDSAGGATADAALPPNAYEYRGGIFRGLIIVMTVVTLVAIILRFISRQLGKNAVRFWWDDWVALASVPFIMTQMGMCFAMLNHGLGRHIAVVPPADIATFGRLLWAIYFVYDTALALTKASALLFLSRVFPARANSQWFNYALYTAHAFNIAWLIGIVIGTVFACNPIEKNWNPMVPGTCGPASALWIGSAVPSVAIDLIILILPLPKIWRLRMSLARKSGISVVFLLGYLVIVVSLGRLITLLTHSAGLNTDITYEVIPVALWVCAEAPVTILCICLPAMLPLGRHLATAYFSPLASKISSTWSSRNDKGSSLRSKSGNFASATESNSYGVKLRGAKSQQSIGDGASFNSDAGTSMRGILPPKDYYSARVRAGDPTSPTTVEMPSQAIRVDKVFKIDRQQG